MGARRVHRCCRLQEVSGAARGCSPVSAFPRLSCMALCGFECLAHAKPAKLAALSFGCVVRAKPTEPKCRISRMQSPLPRFFAVANKPPLGQLCGPKFSPAARRSMDDCAAEPHRTEE